MSTATESTEPAGEAIGRDESGGRSPAAGGLWTVLRYESRRRLTGALALSGLLSLFTLLYVGLYPSISGGTDLDAYVESFPPALREAFNIQTLSTVEGFLAAELYQFGWVVLFGLYLAYSTASLVVEDVERDRMDLLLAAPVSRGAVLLGKFCSTLVSIVLVNVVVLAVVYAATLAIDDPVALGDLAAVHLLSAPYLLACAAVGLLASVVLPRTSYAQRGALGLLFGLFLVDSVAAGTDYAWLGALAPMRYYDPTAVLVEGSYDLGGAALLLAAAVALVGLALVRFRRMDVV